MASSEVLQAQMQRLKAAFPASRFPPETVRIYSEKLARLSDENVRRGVDDAIDKCSRLPSVADIVKRASPSDGSPAFGQSQASSSAPWRWPVADGPCPPHLVGPEGKTRGFPNDAFYDAKARMLARIRETCPGYVPAADSRSFGRLV